MLFSFVFSHLGAPAKEDKESNGVKDANNGDTVKDEEVKEDKDNDEEKNENDTEKADEDKEKETEKEDVKMDDGKY